MKLLTFEKPLALIVETYAIPFIVDVSALLYHGRGAFQPLNNLKLMRESRCTDKHFIISLMQYSTVQQNTEIAQYPHLMS